MSNPKLNAKNLHYDASLPPFLARLKGQHSSFEGPDPILAGQRRAAKKRSGSEEAEDAPLVVDEEGNVVDGVQVGDDGDVKNTLRNTKGTADGQNEGAGAKGQDGDKDGEDREGTAREKVAGIGGGKKRKAGKMIGGGEDGVDEDRKGSKESGGAKKNVRDPKDKAAGKAGKKKAKIKLSFGDDEEG